MIANSKAVIECDTPTNDGVSVLLCPSIGAILVGYGIEP